MRERSGEFSMRQLRRQVPALLRFRFLLQIAGHLDAAPIYCAVRFRNLLTAFGLIVMAVCASAGQTPSGGESGIEGVITVSPANPGPTIADAAGSMPLASATFTVENKNGEVASFITDDQGRFRVSLPPGHYKISLKGRKSSIGRFGPFEADVAPGKMANVQWNCDSGIR
jgi:hypothetical protein